VIARRNVLAGVSIVTDQWFGLFSRVENLAPVDSAWNDASHMLMMLYATGLRRAEMCQLRVSDVDSKRMVIHVRQGKGARNRELLLTPKLLETPREYWRWVKPRTYRSPVR
jgi:integrase